MVLVPALSGLTLSQATAAIQNAGLAFGGNTVENTENSSLNGLVKSNSQSISANTLANYETSVSFILYNYVYVPPAVYETSRIDTGCINGTPTSSTTCSGYTATITTTTPRSGSVTIYYSNGTSSTSSYSCSSLTSVSTVVNSAACGYVSRTCTRSSVTSCNGCSGGYNYCETQVTNTDCSVTWITTTPCCSSSSTSYSAWSACSCKERYRTVTTTTTCGSSSSTSSYTQWASCTGGQIYGC